jgi:hypothetical protein
VEESVVASDEYWRMKKVTEHLFIWKEVMID